jgi:membrane-associated phospholipid phosphatase
MALLTFALYPVAPPWYIADEGFTQPDQKVGLAESAAGLIRVDNYFNNNFFGSIYQTFNANPFAAMPSLHSAFAFISAFFAIRTYREKTRWIWLFAIYPVCIWFSAVYLQHHYILDLMAGVTYVLIADRITLRYYRWKRGRSVKDEITEAIMEEETNGNGTASKTEVEEPLMTNVISESKENK